MGCVDIMLHVQLLKIFFHDEIMYMRKIILAGGTGNLGRLLAKEFNIQGYKVVLLTRNRNLKTDEQFIPVYWDGRQLGDWTAHLEQADAVVNLSGESIQCRYTEINKKLLIDSRVESTHNIGVAIQLAKLPPRLWINFSGVSIFENKPPFSTEESTVYADTFLAKLSKDWEQAFWDAKIAQTKKICFRVSPVLSREFGMLQELYQLAKFGLAGTVGNGKQFVSWIHQEDFARMVSWIVQHDAPSSIYHACAPNAVTNKAFMSELRSTVSMPLGLPLPRFFAYIGAWAKGVEANLLLDSTAVISTQTLKDGFIFRYPTLDLALKNLLS